MINDDNPYSAPTAEHRSKTGLTHHEFQFTDRGILCRTGLELPRICLVTGAIVDLVPYRIRLKWSPLFYKVTLWISFVLIGVFNNLGQNTVWPPQQFHEVKWLFVLGSSVLLIVIVGIKMVHDIVIDAYVSRMVGRSFQKRKWTAIIAALVGAGVGSLLTLLALPTGSEPNFMSVLIVTAVMAALFACGSHWIFSKKSRIDLMGTKLKVVSYHSGQFEITGFPPQFLGSLRQQGSTSDL